MNTRKPFQEMFRLLLGLVLVAAITIAIIATLHVPAPGSATVILSPNPTSSPQQTATLSPEPTTAVPYPFPWNLLTPSAVAAETATAADIFYTQQAISRATDQAYTPPPTAPFTYPPTGTVEDMYIKPSGQKLGMDALNGWRGLWDGKPVGIYVGATLPGSDQGVMVIFINNYFAGQFLTPTRHGGVRVVSDYKDRLTLVSTDGTTYYFDIPTLGFVSSLTAIAPTPTPSPTSVPYIPPPSSTPVPTLYPYPVP